MTRYLAVWLLAAGTLTAQAQQPPRLSVLGVRPGMTLAQAKHLFRTAEPHGYALHFGHPWKASVIADGQTVGVVHGVAIERDGQPWLNNRMSKEALTQLLGKPERSFLTDYGCGDGGGISILYREGLTLSLSKKRTAPVFSLSSPRWTKLAERNSQALLGEGYARELPTSMWFPRDTLQ